MASSDGAKLADADGVRASVSKYYGETLTNTADLKTSACCTSKAPPAEVIAVLRQLPQEIVSRYYGCGSPFPAGLAGSGLRVLDLGCGTGRDCYVCAALVGPDGFVTGVDMTPAQLEVAQRYANDWATQLGYASPNMRFVQGAIECLSDAGIAPGSIDIVISNCVINLSADKAAVLRGAYTALADGGEVFFSDVYCDKRLPEEARTHEVALGECLGGALYVNDFVRLAREAGFTDPRILEVAPVDVHDAELAAVLGGARFYSVTFRLFKLPPGALEPPPCEDYGETITYNGELKGAESAYSLDYAHTYHAGVPARVDGNTAALLTRSWLGKHFTVTTSSSVGCKQVRTHAGQYPCTPPGGDGLHASAAAVAALAAGGGGGGGCCPPKPAVAATGGCCPPKPAVAATGGCCPPKPAVAATGGCCPPKPAVAATGGCCPPKPAVAATGGCCPPKPAAGGGCCPK